MNTKEKDIELRCEEVQEILSRPPHSLIKWGITVFFGVILFLMVGGCFFSYPDTVTAEITITTENPPAWIMARSTGKLKEILLTDKEEVAEGSIIAVIDNPAHTQDVLDLQKQLDNFAINDSCVCESMFTLYPALGEVQTAYASFIKNLTEYRNFLVLDLYKEKEDAARKELKEYHTYITHLNNENGLYNKELKLAESAYTREKTLYEKGLVSTADFEKEQQNLLSGKRNAEQIKSSLSSARIQEAKLKQNIVEIQLERNQQENALQVNLQSALNELTVSIHDWKLKYLFVAPTSGILSYNEVWQKNQNISSGDKVFSIVAKNPGNIIGKAKLPVSNSGKVCPMQRVNISLADYPYMEFGYLTGHVGSISLLANENNYMVTITLPDTLKTSYHHTLDFQGELSGTAEIVTDERSFTSRLMNPLFYLWNKYRN